jgi:hypothetical protein
VSVLAVVVVVTLSVVAGCGGESAAGERAPREVRSALPGVVRWLEAKAGGGDRHTRDGWTWFCFTRYLGNSPVGERFDIYVWEGCQEYRRYRKGMAGQTGWSVPAVITVARRGTGYTPVAERQPRECPGCGPDIEAMFPSPARRAIASIPEGTGPGSAQFRFARLKMRARLELLGER